MHPMPTRFCHNYTDKLLSSVRIADSAHSRKTKFNYNAERFAGLQTQLVQRPSLGEMDHHFRWL